MPRLGPRSRPHEDLVGWFVQIPRALYDQFNRLYPKGAKKKLTIAFIQRAIQHAGEEPQGGPQVDTKQLRLFTDEDR